MPPCEAINNTKGLRITFKAVEVVSSPDQLI